MNLVADALLPPASLAVLALVLLLAGGRRSRRIAIAAVAALLVLAVPVVPSAMLASLAPAREPPGPPPEAIVILSADALRVPAPDQLLPGPLTFDRIREGAILARRTHLPVLVAGGEILPRQQISLATMMSRSLKHDFGVDVRWEEDQSRDTWENASGTAAILSREGISRVYLVTHPWHMRRALIAFRHFGLQATPAPVTPVLPSPLGVKQLIPRAFAWEESYIAFHEWIGTIFYEFRR